MAEPPTASCLKPTQIDRGTNILRAHTHKHRRSLAFTHNFHDVRAPLGQQLQTSQRQVEQLPVLLIGLLAVQARARHHFAVAVARQLRDEANVVLPDLHHLLTQVVLRRDAALGACPPGHRTEKTKGWGWAGADGAAVKNCRSCLGLRAFFCQLHCMQT